jgi:hypothetical protein
MGINWSLPRLPLLEVDTGWNAVGTMGSSPTR